MNDGSVSHEKFLEMYGRRCLEIEILREQIDTSAKTIEKLQKQIKEMTELNETASKKPSLKPVENK